MFKIYENYVFFLLLAADLNDLLNNVEKIEKLSDFMIIYKTLSFDC
jgi:hypothetical protein